MSFHLASIELRAVVRVDDRDLNRSFGDVVEPVKSACVIWDPFLKHHLPPSPLTPVLYS